MVALVTGASRGIGAAAARKLADDGYTVIVHYHRARQRADRLAEEIGGAAMCADLADFNQIDIMIDSILHAYGKIDVLVNNAGAAMNGLYQDILDADALRLMMLNLGGTMHTTKKVLPQMLRRHCGCIVNVASIWGEVGAACEVHYSAAKAGVIGFTKALAKEVGLSGIRVNCVSPGVIETDMNRNYDKETMHILEEETALGCLGKPEDVADAISFLVSPKAGFITGQVISVNGGFFT